MRNLLYLILTAVYLCLTACPYDSNVPLNTYEESLKINKKLIGKWAAIHPDSSFDELYITKAAKTVLRVQHNAYNENGVKVENNYYRAFSIEINGVKIMNIEKHDGKYNFYKYKWVSDDEFVLQSIADTYIEENYKDAKNAKSKELREFIEKNIDQPKMFEEEIRFYKEGSEKYNKREAK
ncbi:MAG: hypothetical protein ABII90_00975 [Bacteroidota bacterium]